MPPADEWIWSVQTVKPPIQHKIRMKHGNFLQCEWTQNHYDKWKKSIIRLHVVCSYSHETSRGGRFVTETTQVSGCPALRGGGGRTREWLLMCTFFLLWLKKVFKEETRLMVVQILACTKICGIVHFIHSCVHYLFLYFGLVGLGLL